MDVSVVIPCKDSGELLRRSVQSALSMDGCVPLVEVVIVDDGSTDPETLSVQAELNTWSGVRLTSNENAPGPAGARNTGVEAADGTWIAFLDSDDMFLPWSIPARWEIVEAEPEARFIASDFEERDESGSSREWLATSLQAGHPLARSIAVARKDTERRWLRIESPVQHILEGSRLVWTGTVMVRRDIFLELEGFDEALRGPEDTHLWLRLAAVTDLFLLAKSTAVYERQEGSLTRRSDSPPKLASIEAFKSLMGEDSLKSYRPVLNERLAAIQANVAEWYRGHGQPWKALPIAAAAVARRPLSLGYWRMLLGSLLRR